MNNIKYLIITVMAFMTVQASFADETKDHKGVKVTDKNGAVMNHFHVDSINVYNDTVTVWNYINGLNSNENNPYVKRIAYPVHYYKPQEVEVFEINRGIQICEGDVEGIGEITVDLGSKNSMLTNHKTRSSSLKLPDDVWTNTYAMPHSKKLVAKDANGKVLDVEWTTDDPWIATVAQDGSIMGHYPGKANITATSLTGETATITVKTVDHEYTNDRQLTVHDFFPNSYGYNRYLNHYYAMELGVWNNTGCNDFDTSFSRCKVDMNEDLGIRTPTINLGILFDKNNLHKTDDYITNVIVVYSAKKVDVSKTFEIDKRTYHYASCIAQKKETDASEATDLNDGAEGKYIYLAYTKDSYPRHGETEQRYLVSHSAMAFYGGRYIDDNNLTDCVYDTKNVTRIVKGKKSKVIGDIGNYKEKMLNLGYDDEAVTVYSLENGEFAKQHDLASLQSGTSERQWISMVCTYEPYCPPSHCWMSKLDDNTPVNSISIPGTHDSATADVEIRLAKAVACASVTPLGSLALLGAFIIDETTYMARTQRFGFKKQFEQGIRWFDIRIDAGSSNGDLVHGSGLAKANTNYTYRSMLKELNECLNSNQGEFIVLDLTPKENGGDDYTTTDIWRETRTILKEDQLIKYHKGLTLKECRGKFLIYGADSEYFTSRDGANGFDIYENEITPTNKKANRCYYSDKDENNISPLWYLAKYELGNKYNDKMRKPEGTIGTKLSRATLLMNNYSTLPIDRDTWLYTDASGYFWGKDNPNYLEMFTSGKYDVAEASYMNARLAHVIKGMNGRPCGIVRMDFAGTNYAQQDVNKHKYAGTNYSYFLSQTVIRNNFIGKKITDEGIYYNTNYATQKEAAPTRGSERVDDEYKQRSECGWVQLWKDGPKFAEFNVGSTIGTYIGMTDYNEKTVGKHYDYPKYESRYDRYSDNARTNWGVDWRTPTPDEIRALLNSENTTIEYMDGVENKYAVGCTLKGYKISGKGDYANNSIFLPAAGKEEGDDNVSDYGTLGLYWGRNAKNDSIYVVETDKPTGKDPNVSLPKRSSYLSMRLSIRPVYEKGKGHPKFQDNRLEPCYYLNDADDLSAYSAFVNGGTFNDETYTTHPTANAELTQDIDMSIFDDTYNPWYSIGTTSSNFQGHFNGNYHRIKNHKGKALFGAVGSLYSRTDDKIVACIDYEKKLEEMIIPCIIENVIIDATCVISGSGNVGGLVNYVYLNDNKNYVYCKIKNCGNEAVVKNNSSEDSYANTAGILGAGIPNIKLRSDDKNIVETAFTYLLCSNDEINFENWTRNTYVEILNCYNTGAIIGSVNQEKHNFCGISGPVYGQLYIANSWNDYTENYSNTSSFYADCMRSGSTITLKNNYSRKYGGMIPADMIESYDSPITVKGGELCYKLNKNYHYFQKGKAVEGKDTVWFQHVGLGHPRFYSELNDTVYRNEFKRCDGKESSKYSNSTDVLDSDIHLFHKDGNGFCYNNAAHYEPAKLDNGRYLICNAGNLYWFAQEYNAGKIASPANVMLMANIQDNESVIVDGQLTSETANLRTWTPIGNENRAFEGAFHGNGAFISGLYCKGGINAGLFGNTKNITMDYVCVENSYFEANTTVDNVACFAGALIAYATNPESVKGCYSTCQVRANGTHTGLYYAGGLVGHSTSVDESKEIFSACYSTSKVTGFSANTGPLFGYLSGVKYANCFHNDKSKEGYRTDREFAMGKVCDDLNRANGSVFMSQWLGDYKTPFFGQIGNFIVRYSNIEWNLITLPYKVNSDESIQYYSIEGIEGNSLIIKPANSVEANTPCFMRCLSMTAPEAEKPYLSICRAASGEFSEIPEKTWGIKNVGDEDRIATIGTLEEVDVSTICDGNTDYQYCYFFKDDQLQHAKLNEVKLPAFASAILCKEGADFRIEKIVVDKTQTLISVSTDAITPESGQMIEAE